MKKFYLIILLGIINTVALQAQDTLQTDKKIYSKWKWKWIYFSKVYYYQGQSISYGQMEELIEDVPAAYREMRQAKKMSAISPIGFVSGIIIQGVNARRNLVIDYGGKGVLAGGLLLGILSYIKTKKAIRIYNAAQEQNTPEY